MIMGIYVYSGFVSIDAISHDDRWGSWPKPCGVSAIRPGTGDSHISGFLLWDTLFSWKVKRSCDLSSFLTDVLRFSLLEHDSGNS